MDSLERSTAWCWRLATIGALLCCQVAPGHADSKNSVILSQEALALEGEAGPPLPRLAGLLQQGGGAISIDFSPDGKVLASGSDDNSVRLWNVATGRQLQSLTGHSGFVYDVSFSPDGKVLASGSSDNSVRLWNVATGRQLQSLTGHSGFVYDVSFSPDGKVLASGSWDKTIRWWDRHTGQPIAELQSFGKGAWMTRFADGTLYRADCGIQVLARDHWNQDFRPFMPPRPRQGRADLIASVTGAPAPVAVQDGKPGPDAILRVENRGDAPAYWVRLLSHDSFSGGFLASATAYRSRLDPGDHFEIPVQVSHLHRPDPGQPNSGPRPRQGTVQLRLTSAYGEDIAVAIPIEVQAPVLEVADFQVLPGPVDQPAAVQISARNKGEQGAERVDIAVEYIDSASGNILGTQARQQASDSLKPGQTTEPLSFTLPPELLDHEGEISARVIMHGEISPTHIWTSVHPLDLGRSWPVYLGLGFAAMLILGAAVIFQLVFRNPVVLRYAAAPDELGRVAITDVVNVQRRLERARRLEPLLEALDIPRARWDRLPAAARDPVQALADVWHAELSPAERIDPGLTLYPVILPDLPIPIESRTAIVEVANPATGSDGARAAGLGDLAGRLERIVTKKRLQGRYLLIVDRTGEQTTGTAAGQMAGQDLTSRLADAPIRLAVIDARDITAILLAENPITALCQIIARMAQLGDISPYQTSGGLDRPDQFVGRQNEVALLTGRDARNHLLIGARQMGKSSLLKRLVHRDPERVHLVTMTGADLAGDLERAELPPLDELGAELRERPSGDADADALVPFLLIDEADKLILADRENDFAVCRHLRAISEEGRCRFVLAGFWELHRAAYEDHQSPLRNFADPLPLGPLSEKAARTLATRPLDPLGLRWASDELVTELITRTGCRPNLIALATDAAIRALPPLARRVLDADLLHATLDMSDATGAPIAAFFQSLEALIQDQRACQIDRMVLYATVGQDTFTLKQARTRIEATGASIPITELRQSLARLTLAYAIQKRAGAYIFPIPLVRDYFHHQSEGNPAEMLALEAQEWIEEQE